ncbi:MAG: hypothetical protein AAGN66_17830 [Acidobacteriota bacterium]
MPLVGTLQLQGTVAATPAAGRAAVAGWVDGTPAPITGTVDRAAVDAYEADTLCVALRVVLGGVELPRDDVLGASFRSAIDEPIREATVRLGGIRYLPTATTDTWTRTPVEIYVGHGPPGAMTETLELRGTVETCRVSSEGIDATVEILCRDLGAIRDTELCLEVEPLAGLTRDELCRQLAAAAGYTETDIPAADVITGPVSVNQKLTSMLEVMGRAPGWSWTTTNDGVLRAYTPRLKAPPLPPDHVWTVHQLDEAPEQIPPEAVPSKWVLRGQTAVEVDEQGLETETTTSVVFEQYAPAVADAYQDAAGAITPLEISSRSSFQEVSRLVETVTRRGDLVVYQSSEEWGWYNPAHSRAKVQALGGGGELVPVPTYLSGGNHVTYRRERYQPISRRLQSNVYDGSGTVLSTRADTWSWYRREAAVQAADAPDLATGPAYPGAVIGDDNTSYDPAPNDAVEQWGHSQRETITYQYGAEGALQVERRVVEGYYAIKGAVTTGNHVNYSGNGQAEKEAQWRQVRGETRTSTTDTSGRLAAEIETESGFTASPNPSGTHSWGSFASDDKQESYRTVRQTRRLYKPLHNASYEVETYEAGRRSTQTYAGTLPVPRYRQSPWTRLRQVPVDLEYASEVLEEWFGPETRVLQEAGVQDAEQARAVLQRDLERAISYELPITRPATYAQLGDTVLYRDPQRHLVARALVTQRELEVTLNPPSFTGRYLLEAPLFESIT